MAPKRRVFGSRLEAVGTVLPSEVALNVPCAIGNLAEHGLKEHEGQNDQDGDE